MQNTINMAHLTQNHIINDEPQIKISPINSFYPGDFMYYKDIVINNSKVTGNHSNFPVLISLLDSDLQDYAHKDGYDIMFYSITDSEWLEHEIEYYKQNFSSSEAKLVAWIKVPTVSESGSSHIRMYFGNSNIISTEEIPGECWNNYLGVWHLCDNPTGSIKDSTLKYNGSSQGTMNINNQVTGKIDGSLEFDGTTDRVDFGNISLLEKDITVSFWMQSSKNDTMTLIDKYPGASIGECGWTIRLLPNDDLMFRVGNNGIFGWDALIVENISSYNNFVHVTCTYDGTSQLAYIYINGIEVSGKFMEISIGNINNNNVSLRFGIPAQFMTGERFQGMLDEVHITNFVRSANWIKTEYSNQNDPSDFYFIGSLNSPGLNPPNVIITSPLNSSVHEAPSLTIRATITDDETEIIGAIATIDNGTIQNDISMSQVNSTTWECTWDFSSSSFLAQDYTITITAQDSHFNINDTESVKVTIQKDLTPPEIIFISPIDGVFVEDPFTITAIITDSAGNDPGDGDVFATIKYGGNTLFNLELDRIVGANIWTAEWSNITFPDYQLGDYTIDITARDTSFYQNERTMGSRTVTLIDTHAPIVIIDSMYSGPYGQYQSYSEIEIKATITDSKSSVEQAIAIISGPEPFSMSMNFNGDKWTCLWNNITDYTNGNYTITIWTIDSEGNVNQQETITVTINNLQEPPSNEDNGKLLIIIIGIITFIGSVGSAGLYGLVKVKRKRSDKTNLYDKHL